VGGVEHVPSTGKMCGAGGFDWIGLTPSLDAPPLALLSLNSMYVGFQPANSIFKATNMENAFARPLRHLFSASISIRGLFDYSWK